MDGFRVKSTSAITVAFRSYEANDRHGDVEEFYVG